MKVAVSPHPARTTLLERIRRAQFFSISLALHCVLLALLGGVVLFKSAVYTESFVTVGNDLLSEGGEETSNEHDGAEEEFEEPSSNSTYAAELAQTSVIDSLAVSSTFEVSNVADRQVLGVTLVASSIDSGIPSLVSSAPGKGSSMGSLFGTVGVIGNGLVGYMYDLKQTKLGAPSEMAVNPQEKNVAIFSGWTQLKETEAYDQTVRRFVRGDWDASILGNFYRARNPLTITQFLIPKGSADLAPKAFGVENEVTPRRWLVHYKGTIVAAKSGKFRFVGYGDDVLIVRFNRKNVLDGSFNAHYAPEANDQQELSNGPGVGQGACRIGRWFEVSEGSSYSMETLIGESPGGHFSALLYIQDKAVQYKPRPVGGLTLPVFQTRRTHIAEYVDERTGPSITAEPLVFGKE